MSDNRTAPMEGLTYREIADLLGQHFESLGEAMALCHDLKVYQERRKLPHYWEKLYMDNIFNHTLDDDPSSKLLSQDLSYEVKLYELDCMIKSLEKKIYRLKLGLIERAEELLRADAGELISD